MPKEKFSNFITFARSIFEEDFIPLHRPVFEGLERKYLLECIDSNFVSSVGKKVDEFEKKVCEFTGSKYAVATVNGTAALHTALMVSGVARQDEVITQALTFVATCNAIHYCGAHPILLDVDIDTMGLSPSALKDFLLQNTIKKDGCAWNISTGRRIAACVPMHTFGFPCRVDEIVSICNEWGINVVEDAAESLGSSLNNCQTGTFGQIGITSFNGNKIITSGGGGMLLTNSRSIALEAKHLTTTAKLDHQYEFRHDRIGYNYRMPNLNAALGCAQLERLPEMLEIKRVIAERWAEFFEDEAYELFVPITGAISNNWLNTVILPSRKIRDEFLNYSNDNGVMTRPIWQLMSELTMFNDAQKDSLRVSKWLADRVVNIPSSVPNNLLS